MKKPDVLKEVVEESRAIRLIEEDIYSVLAKKATARCFEDKHKFLDRRQYGICNNGYSYLSHLRPTRWRH